jgi:hypothetical protein
LDRNYAVVVNAEGRANKAMYVRNPKVRLKAMEAYSCNTATITTVCYYVDRYIKRLSTVSFKTSIVDFFLPVSVAPLLLPKMAGVVWRFDPPSV